MEKSKSIKFSGLCALILTVGLGTALFAAQKPMDVIKESNQLVLDILKDKKTIDDPTEAKLLEIIDGVTDFAAISREVVRPFCEKLDKKQCGQFDAVFIRLLRISSLKKMGRYRADRFEYLSETATGNKAQVKTFAFYKQERAELVYHLELNNGKWKIVNYVIDDIDTVHNYKKQFTRLFAKMTVDKVIERLEEKIAEYGKESRDGE